jgi:hypothetical protein
MVPQVIVHLMLFALTSRKQTKANATDVKNFILLSSIVFKDTLQPERTLSKQEVQPKTESFFFLKKFFLSLSTWSTAAGTNLAINVFFGSKGSAYLGLSRYTICTTCTFRNFSEALSQSEAVCLDLGKDHIGLKTAK